MRSLRPIVLPILIALPGVFAVRSWAENHHAPEKYVERVDEEPIATVLARLRSERTLRAAFRQERHLKQLVKPLVSSGDFLLDAQQSAVAWKQLTPFPIAYVINRAGLHQLSFTHGIEDQNLPPSPFVSKLSSVLLSVFTGDSAAIKDSFDVSFAGTVEEWRIDLHSKDEAIAQIIANISISGKALIEQVELQNAQGDRTKIEFSNTERAPSFSAAEKAILEHGGST